MAIKQVKVFVEDLRPDMYISGLDRPWGQSHFPVQGFYVRTADDIRKVQRACKYVYVDVNRGVAPEYQKHTTLGRKRKPDAGDKVALERNQIKEQMAPLPLQKGTYPEPQTSLQKELSRSESFLKNINFAVSEVMSQIERGEVLAYQEVKQAASGLVGSIVRNPDALTWLSRVKEKDEYTLDHAVRCAVWALLFARHAGLRQSDMEILVQGVLMKDVGKVRLPQDVLLAQQRDREQQEEYERFVQYGVEILRNTDGVNPKVISVVKNHCERMDGSGFPAHLKGDKIPLLSKIAGIVTVYDEITNPRFSQYPLSPSKAVAELYKLRNRAFQEELVVEFIQSVGLYPTGTVVELTSGEIGVVIEQNFGRRLKPKVAIVRSAEGQSLSRPTLVDMLELDTKRQELLKKGKSQQAEKLAVDVLRDVEPSTAGVDVAQVLSHFHKKGILSFFR